MEPVTASAVAVATVVAVPKLIVTGICLGLGFYVAKKMTNWADEKLAARNPQVQQILAEAGM